MARQRLDGKGKQLSQEEKKARLQKRYTEWNGNEISLRHAYLNFKIAQTERGNSKATLDAYDRCYKKICAMIEQMGQDDNNTPVNILEMEGIQLVFTMSLGEVSQQTINHYLRSFRAFGNFCEDKGYIEGFECPIKEVEPPVKHVYTDAELQRLISKPKLEDFEEFRNYIIILLILSTGLRVNSILNLKIEDVDLTEGYINVNTTKAHKTVRLGLERKAQRDLAEYVNYWRKRDGVYVTDALFPNMYNEPLTRSGLSKAIRGYNRKRGVEKTSIHLLRHTFAKKWIESGGDIITLAKVLTHSELKMVKRYSNLYDTDVKDEIESHSALSQMRQRSGKTLKSKG